MHIDDCTEGVYRLMHSECRQPVNLGTDRLVTINELVDIVCEIAGKTLEKRHNLTGPQGVRGRNSDNTLVREVLGWEPSVALEDGLAVTYNWIKAELESSPTSETSIGMRSG
jgi:nucleoside-diphosphate-sugar epimerase